MHDKSTVASFGGTGRKSDNICWSFEVRERERKDDVRLDEQSNGSKFLVPLIVSSSPLDGIGWEGPLY